MTTQEFYEHYQEYTLEENEWYLTEVETQLSEIQAQRALLNRIESDLQAHRMGILKAMGVGIIWPREETA